MYNTLYFKAFKIRIPEVGEVGSGGEGGGGGGKPAILEEVGVSMHEKTFFQ